MSPFTEALLNYSTLSIIDAPEYRTFKVTWMKISACMNRYLNCGFWLEWHIEYRLPHHVQELRGQRIIVTKQGIAYPSFSGGLNLLDSFFVNFLGFVLLFLFLKVCFVMFNQYSTILHYNRVSALGKIKRFFNVWF